MRPLYSSAPSNFGYQSPGTFLTPDAQFDSFSRVQAQFYGAYNSYLRQGFQANAAPFPIAEGGFVVAKVQESKAGKTDVVRELTSATAHSVAVKSTSKIPPQKYTGWPVSVAPSSFVQSLQVTQSNGQTGVPVPTIPYAPRYGGPVSTLSHQFAVQPHTVTYSPPQVSYLQYQGGVGFQPGYQVVQQPVPIQVSHGQYPWGGGFQPGYQVVQQPVQYSQAPYGAPFIQPQFGMRSQQTNSQQVPLQFPINDADFRMHEKATSMGVRAYSKAYTESVFVQQPLAGGRYPIQFQTQPAHYSQAPSYGAPRHIPVSTPISPAPQLAQPPTPQQPDAQYDFIMNGGTIDKIVFDLKKNKVEPAFNTYFNGFGIGVDKKEEKYTKALVFEQKIKAIGFRFASFGLDTLSDPEYLNSLTEDRDATNNNALKDSAGTTNNKIKTIFDKYNNDSGFKTSIKATLQKGIALQTKSDPRANGLRNVLLRGDLTKEDAGQIAKAISILDAGTETGDAKVGTKINDLIVQYLSPAPQQPPSLSASQPQPQPQHSSYVNQLGANGGSIHRASTSHGRW